MVAVEELLTTVVWTVFGAVVGVVLSLLSFVLIPRIADALTPDINERQEIKKGNLAVAVYMGLILGGVAVALGIIIGAAIIAGIHGA